MSHKHTRFAVQNQIFGCAFSHIKLPSMYRRWQGSTCPFFPIEGGQRDGSPPCRAPWGKELSGTGRFPLSEQVRPCTSSHIDHSSCSGVLLTLIIVCMFTSQQLSGEEDSGRKHCTSLQRPAPQARVSKVAAQIEGIPAHRYNLEIILKNFSLLGASSPNNPIFLLYNSELCRRNGPGCCSEASVPAVCRPGEALFNHLYTLV